MTLPTLAVVHHWTQPGRTVTAYGAAHVNILRAMLRRHAPFIERLVVFSDGSLDPTALDPGVEVLPIHSEFVDLRRPGWAHVEHPQCYRRISLWAPRMQEVLAPATRILALDLDVVIGAPMTALLDRPEPIVFLAPRRSRLYNASMILMDIPSDARVWSSLTPEALAALPRTAVGSDQAWLEHVYGPGQPIFDPNLARHWGDLNRAPPTLADRVPFMAFAGLPKPDHLLGIDPWVTEHYRAG